MPPRGRCGTTKCFRLGVPRTPRAAGKGFRGCDGGGSARASRRSGARRAPRSVKDVSSRGTKKRKRSFLGRIRRDEVSPAAFPVRCDESANCRRLAAITRRRARLTVARPRRGASRTLQAGLRRRGPEIPPDPFQASRSRSEEKRASRGRRRTRSSSCRVDSSRCRRRHRATAVSAQTPSRKPGGRSAPLVETRTSPHRAMGSRASPNLERSACASRAPNVSCSARSAAPSRRAETRSARA